MQTMPTDVTHTYLKASIGSKNMLISKSSAAMINGSVHSIGSDIKTLHGPSKHA